MVEQSGVEGIDGTHALLMLRCSWVQGQKKMVSSTDLAPSAPGAPSGEMSWVLPTLMGSYLDL